ncbi:hypothetical protein ACFLUU_08325 [Chloroflexota bacterium]
MGIKTIVQNITKSLKQIGIELVSLTEMSEVITLLKQKTFAPTLSNSLTEYTEAVCYYICGFLLKAPKKL